MEKFDKRNWPKPLMVFIVGSVFIGDTLSNNTFLCYLKNLRSESENIIHSFWNRLLDITGDDPFTLWVTYTTIYLILLYWTVSGIYAFMDITIIPKFMRKYKVQPETNEPVDRERLIKAIKVVIFNQLISIPVIFLIYLSIKSSNPHPRELPALFQIFYQLVLMVLLNEIIFYYSHRSIHNKYLYKHIHKKHHEWTAPVALTATYCHPLEHLFSNLLSVCLPIVLLNTHLFTTWIWYTIAITSTLKDHSGYKLPFVKSPEPHDYHHLKFNQCFGVIGLCDWLHGTDSVFQSMKSVKNK